MKVKDNKDFKVVLILGTGHCGSTLLDLILSSHSQCVGVGELKALRKKLNSNKSATKSTEGGFWNDDLMKKLLPYLDEKSLFKRIMFALMPGLSRNRVIIYQEIQKKAEKSILIDSSKDINWVKRSMDQLVRNGIEPYLIYLNRDPIAVTNSYYKKYPVQSLLWHAREIKQRIAEMDSYYSRCGSKKLSIKYEDLAESPEMMISNICNFLGISFELDMLRFWEHDHIQLSGNAGTKSMVKRYQKKENRINLDSKRKDYYSNNSGIQLDERWRTELTLEEIASIEKVLNS